MEVRVYHRELMPLYLEMPEAILFLEVSPLLVVVVVVVTEELVVLVAVVARLVQVVQEHLVKEITAHLVRQDHSPVKMHMAAAEVVELEQLVQIQRQ
jgi:hypothetical protein